MTTTSTRELKLFLVAYVDEEDNNMDQLIWAEDADQADELWRKHYADLLAGSETTHYPMVFLVPLERPVVGHCVLQWHTDIVEVQTRRHAKSIAEEALGLNDA